VTDEGGDGLTLGDVLVGAASELGDVTESGSGDATTWSRAGIPFATLSAARAEFRLDPLVARAALRTPDTAPSARGPEWVAFAPAEVDESAADRADAWFLSAHRRAAGGGRPTR
jgi:hypothetical protein